MSEAAAPVRVYMCHMRDPRVGYCVPGLRVFFARHGLNFMQFAREGIPAEQLEGTGDAMALKVAALARLEAESAHG